MFNIYFLKNYFKILWTGIPTDHVCRYILESWKRIIVNVTPIVNSSTELQMVLMICYLYRRINKNTNNIAYDIYVVYRANFTRAISTE